MSRYELSPRAAANLVDIVEFIARDSPRAARRVLDRLRAAMRRLAEHPRIGHRRAGLSQDIRLWAVHAYLIAYRARPEPLRVLRILSGFRDLATLLR